MSFDIGLSNIFLDISSKARETKPKINKWDYIKLKRLAQQRKLSKKKKKKEKKGLILNSEKIFAEHILDKGLISKIYKELSLSTRG